MKAAVEANLEHLRPWMPWALGEPPSLDDRIGLLRVYRANFDQGKDYTYGIFAPDGSRVIGGCGLHGAGTERAFQIGYWLAADLCGQGLMTEIALALVHAGFLVAETDRMEIRCDPDNLGSRRVAEKVGFNLEGLRRRHFFGFPEGPRDSLVFTLFRDQLGPRHLGGGTRMFDSAGRFIGA
jgi:RimJ/RimL family protein N-acetyltransferase